MKLERRNCKRGRIEIIPMIDTILILLIFYMSFSSFSTTEKRLEARLPLGDPGGTGVVDLVIHVRNETEIIVNGTTFDQTSFRATLTGLSAATENVNLVIEAEAGTTYQAIINVMDACAQAKLTRVAFRPLS
ncbi:MAG: biopolymer transporter ExbD [Verrucomicrobiota bacterium]